MEGSVLYAQVRAHLRKTVGKREKTLLPWFRLMRCALIQGPWQSWFVRYYQTHDRNSPIAVFEDSLFPHLDIRLARRRLELDACAEGLAVPTAMVDEIVRFAREDGAKRIDDAHLRCPEVRRIAHDPRIVAVAREYLQAEPILLETKIYWTIPKPDEQGRVMAPAEDGLFHYDLVDVKAVAVFVYLTDVDPRCGPHVVIRGTQRRKSLTQILRRSIDDDEAQLRYGDRIQMMLGPRGTGWFEDITCYHKHAGGEKDRLMLCILYSLHRTALTVPRS